MSEYDRPQNIIKEYGVARSTGCRWVAQGHVRKIGSSSTTMWHRGDFEEMVASRNASGWATYLPRRSFYDPVPDGQCHNVVCDQPATTLSTLHLCTKHEMILRSQKGEYTPHPVRCMGCQDDIPRSSRSGMCTSCSRRGKPLTRAAA